MYLRRLYMAKNNYSYFLNEFQGQLPVGECFDLMDRLITIGGRSGHIYFVDGLTDGDKLQRLLNFLYPLVMSQCHLLIPHKNL